MAVEALPEKSSENHIKLVADIVSAFVSNNSVPLADLPALILSVHETLAGVGSAPAQASVSEPLVPAVSVKKSITSDFLICLEDGKRFKSLRRHLGKLGMTPEEYRTKWSLPSDYPMVAPAYSATRSALAKSIGLGINNTRAAAATMKPSAKMKGPAKGRGRSKRLAA